MKELKFQHESTVAEVGSNCHILNVPAGIRSRAELFDVYGEGLKFPQYFGRNFDALYDMLCDLNWISAEKILIVHNDLPFGDAPESLIYLRVLSDAIVSWRGGSEHDLEVLFPENTRPSIDRIYNASA